MALTGSRTYVGIGFGAIQAGLFLYEAYQSGAFARLLVAEVVPEVVAALRATGGSFAVNIAHARHIESLTLGPVALENPAEAADRERIIAAIAAADEIGTAVPSVATYTTPDTLASVRHLLAEGLRRKAAAGGAPCVVYTAENDNHAAEFLEAIVMRDIPEDERAAVRAKVRFLNTVIGKMSGTVTDPAEIAARGLLPITPGGGRAYLVESFNRILISQIDYTPPFTRGISVFTEKPDLLPFEEAKLYGHNATHALLAYLAQARGLPLILNLQGEADVIPFARAAFLEESGAALCRKYAGSDPLFTSEGYRAYADDLLERMMNPFLRDSAERVGRDPARKLAWNDRLIGVMRLALAQGITPRRYAVGAAAGVRVLRGDADGDLRDLLLPLWGDVPHAEREAVLALIAEGDVALKAWLGGKARLG
jgi:mannitol-1-phosphate 5-dehydrogenase